MSGILLEGEAVSDEERAAHAWAMSERNRQEAVRLAAEARARIGEAALAASAAVPGHVVADEEVAAGAPFSITVAAGNRLRIIDLEGRQGVDLLCYDAADHENRYNAGNTIKFNRSIYVGEDFRLYSDSGRRS